MEGVIQLSERDTHLWRDVLNALQSKLETEAADIHLIIQGGKVVLSGVVDVYADKLAADEAVRSVPGVEELENDLTVATDGTIADKEIKSSIEEGLRQNHLPVVGIEVNQGEVFLQGKTNSLAVKHGITAATSRVMGVKSVDDRGLQIAETVDDASLTNAIEVAFVQREVDAMDIHTETHHGVAVLMGWVKDEVARNEALQAAARVPGVRRVVDRLRVRGS